MSRGAGPSNKPKTYHFHTEWEDFFTMSFLSAFASSASVPLFTEEGKCGVAFSDCSLKQQHRLPSEKNAEKEKGNGKFATEASFWVSHFIKQEVIPRWRDGKRGTHWSSWVKTEILSLIIALQLSRSIVMQCRVAMAKDFTQQLLKDQFLTAVGRIYMCPVVHFYSDGVFWYRYKRGAVNSAANERTHARSGHILVIQ